MGKAREHGGREVVLNIVASLLAFLFAIPAGASTGFHIGNGLTQNLPSIYGISTGWYYEIDGAVTANPKNVQKTAELFGKEGPTLSWTSRYGSVSKTMHGLEFPMSGMNERGLMIQATVLSNEKFPQVPKGGFGLFSLQWIQYQLDTSSSLAEVIGKSVTLDTPVIPQGGTDLQFQVCDLSDCAVISFYESKAVAQGSIGLVEADFLSKKSSSDASKRWLLSAITNYTYAESIAVYDQCKAFPCSNPDNSLDRFLKATQMVQHFVGFQATDLDALLDEVMAQLKQVDQGHPLTTWNEAYAFLPSSTGTRKMLMTYKAPTRPGEDRQWIDFSDIAFDCRQPVKLWWLDLKKGGGDQTGSWAPHTRAAQEKLILQNASLYPEQSRKLFVDYPFTKTKCLD
ncbi:MAG: hypothetical protein ACXVBE_08215 [Bdellovibrionota bacterium]